MMTSSSLSCRRLAYAVRTNMDDEKSQGNVNQSSQPERRLLGKAQSVVPRLMRVNPLTVIAANHCETAGITLLAPTVTLWL